MPIDLIDTIKPKNNGTFPMVEAEDVVVGKGTADEKRLPEALAEAGKVAAVDTAMPEAPADDHVPSTQLLKEQLAGYLKLTGGTLQKGATITIPYSGNEKIDSLRLRLIRGVRGDDATINGALFLNYQSTTVPTEDYLKDVEANTEKYAVFVAGWGEEALVLRKCDGDYLYAPKTHAHSDYLSLSLTEWQHIKGPISFDYAHPSVASANIYSINGIGNNTQVVEHGLLYINCNVAQDTNTYLSGMRRVMIAGHPALRKIDGDTLYAAKADVYTKAQVDGKYLPKNNNISFSAKEANGVKTITLSRWGEQLNIGVATDGSATIDFMGGGKSASIEFYSKAQVDEKITSALGDISAALAAI